MLGILSSVLEILENIPQYILYSAETLANGFFSLIELALEAASAVLGELPEIYTPPKYIGEINWFYPVGTMIGIAVPFISAYVLWLGASWVYRKFGAIS